MHIENLHSSDRQVRFKLEPYVNKERSYARATSAAVSALLATINRILRHSIRGKALTMRNFAHGGAKGNHFRSPNCQRKDRNHRPHRSPQQVRQRTPSLRYLQSEKERRCNKGLSLGEKSGFRHTVVRGSLWIAVSAEAPLLGRGIQVPQKALLRDPLRDRGPSWEGMSCTLMPGPTRDMCAWKSVSLARSEPLASSI